MGVDSSHALALKIPHLLFMKNLTSSLRPRISYLPSLRLLAIAGVSIIGLSLMAQQSQNATGSPSAAWSAIQVAENWRTTGSSDVTPGSRLFRVEPLYCPGGRPG